MRVYPRLDFLAGDDVIVEVTLIPAADVASFADEVAHELGAILGINREAARPMVVIDQKDAIHAPVPSMFELSTTARRLFAADIAKLIAFAVGASRSAA